MQFLKKAAAVTAVLLLGSSLTACHFSVHIGGDSSSTPDTVSETVPADAQTEPAEAQENAETAAPPDSAEAAQEPVSGETSAVCGKWEIASLGGNSLDEGQYGSEEYCRLYQMEFKQDGTAAFYARCDGKESTGAWMETAPGTVQLLVQDDFKQIFYPLGLCDCIFTLADDTLTAQTNLGELVIRKTDSFTERSHPEIAWLTGEWRASEITDSSGNLITALPNGQPIENLRVSFFSISDTVGMYITESEDTSDGDIYFAHLQNDGSFLVQQEFEEGNLPEFRDSVLRVENEDQLLWFVKDQEIGIVQLKRQ